jgi:hypothetical protein
MINKNDFTLTEIRIPDGIKDYWFQVSGDSATDLLDRVCEQSMVCVSDVVMAYENGNWILGVKVIYPFNFNVLLCDFQDVKDILVDIIASIDEFKVTISDKKYF